MKKISSFALLIFFFTCLYILFFKADWLVIILIQNPLFPLGSLISWLTIIIFALFVYTFLPSYIDITNGKVLKISAKIVVLLAVFWGPLSYFLSGNWTWSFQNKLNFFVWIIFTGILILVVFCLKTLWKRLF
jgi:hypothetical protein